MADIADRLREHWASQKAYRDDGEESCCLDLGEEAADEIERLRAENQTLRNAGVDLLDRADALHAALRKVAIATGAYYDSPLSCRVCGREWSPYGNAPERHGAGCLAAPRQEQSNET